MIHVKDAQKQLLGDAKIGRNVVITYANGVRVNRPIDDQFVDCKFRILGKYSPDRATRYLRRLTGDRTITINTCDYTCDYYQMPLAQFMTFAHKPSELNEQIG